MKNFPLSQLLIFVLIATTLSGCQVIGDIFEAGVWVGVLAVVLVVVLVIWLLKRLLS